MGRPPVIEWGKGTKGLARIVSRGSALATLTHYDAGIPQKVGFTGTRSVSESLGVAGRLTSNRKSALVLPGFQLASQP